MPTNYQLNIRDAKKTKEPIMESLKKFAPFLVGEGRIIAVTIVAVIVSSLSTLLAPIIIGHTIDTAIA